MVTETIDISSLLLDVENPRHEPVASQADAIRAMIEGQGGKITELARDIAANGFSPVERMLVLKQGRQRVVLEGNRRVVAAKLLNNPDLAAGTGIEAEIKRIAAQATHRPGSIDASVAKTRDEARHWLILRHRGEQDGAGVVPWDTLTAARFSVRPGSHAARALAFIEAAQAAYPDNETIQTALAEIASSRPTTLGRLLAEPEFRDYLGLGSDQGTLVSHYSVADLEKVIQKVVEDVATRITVTHIKTKEQRLAYIAGLPKLKKSAYKDEPAPLATGGASAASASTGRRRVVRPASPFKDLDLANLHPRIADIVAELRKLDLDKFPNAAAVLCRVVLELSVDEFLAKSHLAQDGKLREKVKRCLVRVDPSQKDKRFQAVRAGLQDGSSVFAVATLSTPMSITSTSTRPRRKCGASPQTSSRSCRR